MNDILPNQDLLTEMKSRKDRILCGARRRLEGRKDGRTIVKYISNSVDELLVYGWQQLPEEVSSQVDLVGIGGYGRAELSPFSDWDILFLIPDRVDKNVLTALSKFAQLIWDVGGNLGHSVRTVKDARRFFKEDHHARTAFLESRLIAGRGSLYKHLYVLESPTAWDKKLRIKFCRQKLEECYERRLKLGNTAFCMEPDCKNGKGGLRDVSTIFWLSMAWYQVPAARQLVKDGVVSSEEFNAFVRARDFLWRVRAGLHLISGRENDRLIFEHQLILAKRFRYRDDKKNGAVERFLKKYFLNVRMIADLSDLFLLHFKELTEPTNRIVKESISHGISIKGRIIEIADESEFLSDPLNLLRIFKMAQDNHCEFSSKALRMVRKNATLITAAHRAKKETGIIFLDILRASQALPKLLRQMHETGVLGQVCPDFKRITGHGQFDRYHHYTVDAHTIVAVSHLRELEKLIDDKNSASLVVSLLKELDRPELLYIAVIYHDIAKGRGGDHSELGAELAKKFSVRIGISSHDAELISWLVLNHLNFSKTAQHHNLNDTAVIEEFSKFIGDRQRLVYLFLLTIVDVAAVGPGTLTDWKLHLFVQLFYATDDFLRTGRLDVTEQLERIDSRKMAASLLLPPKDRASLQAQVEILPETLLLNLAPESIVAVCDALKAPFGIDLKGVGGRGYTRLLAWGLDKKGLLSNLAAALARSNIKIITAHVHTLKDGRVLDEFHITDENDNPIAEKSYLERIKASLIRVFRDGTVPLVDDGTFVPDVLMKSLPVSVRPHPSAAHGQTAIEVVAADRRGLLASLSGVIAEAGLILRGANVRTFGEKAVDVFFITDENGGELSELDTRDISHELEKIAQLTY